MYNILCFVSLFIDGPPDYWTTELLDGLRDYWITGLLDYWTTGPLDYLMDYGTTGLLDHWTTGLLDYCIPWPPHNVIQQTCVFVFLVDKLCPPAVLLTLRPWRASENETQGAALTQP